MKEWKFRKGRHVEEIECTVFMSFLSLRHGGQANIKDHLMSKKHIYKISSASSSRTVDYFFSKPYSDKIHAIEFTTAYHTIKQHNTFCNKGFILRFSNCKYIFVGTNQDDCIN